MATNDAPTAATPRRARSAPVLRLPGRGAPLAAYVLHRYDWSETSLIVELFTREQGRVVVAAKGAKRPTSQLRAVLLPFQPLHALLGKTPVDADAEIHNLRGAEWAGTQPLLGAAALFSGYYVNELLLKLLARQDPHPALFDAYADTLGALARDDDDAATLRAFELLLLRELGVLPELDRETLTAVAVDAARRYTLHAEAGVVADDRGLDGADWAALEAALAPAAEHGRADALRRAVAPCAAALRAPLRQVVDYHLGPALLRTRQVWHGVRALN